MNISVMQVLVFLAFIVLLSVFVAATAVICFYLHRLTISIHQLDRVVQDSLTDTGRWIAEGVSAQDKTVAKLNESIDRMSFVQEKTAGEVKSIADLPKHVLAYAKMGLALVQEVQKLRACVTDFSGIVLKTDSRKLDNLILPDEEEQNTVFEIQSLLAMDPTITEDEARQKVTAAREREMQMSVD